MPLPLRLDQISTYSHGKSSRGKHKPSDNQHLLRTHRLTLDVQNPPIRLQRSLITLDIDRPILLHNLIRRQRIQSRRILHIACRYMEASYQPTSQLNSPIFTHSAQLAQLAQLPPTHFPFHSVHQLTSMPRTSQPPIWRQHAVLQRRPVVRAARAGGIHLAADLRQQHLAALDPVDLDLGLLPV